MEDRIVVCLCVVWCCLCDDYGLVLCMVVVEFEGLCVEWIDIEDEVDLVGDFDVEIFLMIVVIGFEGLCFVGLLML